MSFYALFPQLKTANLQRRRNRHDDKVHTHEVWTVCAYLRQGAWRCLS